MTEASDLSNENSITLQVPGSNQTLTIPSVRVRRADTTLEIPSGGSLAMAGMIQEQTKQQINGMPGLMQLPVLGTLFRSRDYLNRQSELMVIVTPYVVRAVAQKDLSRPDDGFADVSDPSRRSAGSAQSNLRHCRAASIRASFIGEATASSWIDADVENCDDRHGFESATGRSTRQLL